MLEEMPANVGILETCEPVYEELNGWDKDISSIKKADALPKAAKDYIHYIEKQTGIPVSILSIGNRRDEAIILENPFSK